MTLTSLKRLSAALLLSAACAQPISANTLGREFLWPDPAKDNSYLLPISRALDAGSFELAEDLIRARLVRVPNDPIAYEVLGVTLSLRGDTDGADAAYAKSLDLEPRRLSAWVKRGDLAEALGNGELAVEYWSAALEISETYTPALLRLALVAAEKGDLDTAIQHYEAAVAAQEAPELRLLTDLAFVYNRSGRPQDALRILPPAPEAATEDGSETPAADPRHMLALGNAQAQVGDVGDALASYDLGLATAPEDLTLLRAKGALLVETGDVAAAVQALALPAAATPVDAYANLQYARALLVTGKPAEAANAADRAAAAETATDIKRQALSVSARAHLMNSSFEDATLSTSQMVALTPNDITAWREHAAIHGAIGQYEASKLIFDDALERFADDPELLRGRSLVQIRLEDLEGAAADAARATEVAPEWRAAHFLLGEIQQSRGLNDAAEAAFQATLEIDADHWPSLVRLAELRLEAGDTEEAVILARRAVRFSDGAEQAVQMLERARAAE